MPSENLDRDEFEKNARQLLHAIGTGITHALAGDHEDILFGSGAVQDDNFDPLNDPEFLARLDALGEFDKSDFIRIYEKRKASVEPDDPLSLKQYALLDLDSMVQSAAFGKRHSEAISKIDVDILQKIQPSAPEPLTPPEIRFLDRIAGSDLDCPRIPGYFTGEYQMDFKAVMEKLFTSGYLTFSTTSDSIKMSDMQTLRKLAKDKGLKAGGKKVDIAQRILDNYTSEELEALDLPIFYVTTEAGKQLLKENEALIRFYLTFSHEWTTPESIIEAQNAYPHEDGVDILIRLLKEKITQTESVFNKKPLYHYLHNLYCQKHDDKAVQEVNAIIQPIDIEWEKAWKEKRILEEQEIIKKLGITPDEYESLHSQAREAVTGFRG